MRSPLDLLLDLPADIYGALRHLPAIARNTEAMEAHTRRLQEVAGALEQVSDDTEALPALLDAMGHVAAATAVLEPMDARMATIEAAMPVLVEVQQHLAALPDTIGALDARIGQLSELMERMLVSMDGLSRSVGGLQEAVIPMGRLASRLPGQARGRA